MIRTTSTAAILFACAAGVAQAAAPLRPDLATLQAVPRIELPAAAVQKAIAASGKNQPYRYAVPVDLELEAIQGLWLARGNEASWRLRLQSRGAQSLSLHLPKAALPAGATLWAYDPAGRLVHGPYRPGRTGLWTAPVGGDELVIEVRAPATGGTLRLGSARAFHGYRGWYREASADNCNIDITCAQADAWEADGGAVARVAIGGQFFCTGQLLNNQRQDQRRLFLTADHCGVDGEGGPADSVMFYFNYTGPCGNNVSDPVPPPTFQGSVRLAHDVQTDFALLLITDTAPLPAGVYFSGWDATGATPQAGGVTIHHPSGDEKKIAFHDMVPIRSPADIGTHCIIPAWQIQWSEGTTEQGSSGGGLWDPQHHMIGWLSGGFASCRTPLQPDYFARMERAWTAREAIDGQLKAHLDPDNTCVAIVPGLDPDTTPAPGPVPATVANVKCSGGASTCLGGNRDAGALGHSTALLLLGLALRRRASRRA